MISKKVEYTKPKPNHKCKLYTYAGGTKFDLETRARETPTNNISRYRKLSKMQMLDTVDNRIIRCKPKENKDINTIVKTFKFVYRTTTENFYGTEAELLIKLNYANEPINMTNDWKYCFPKLERRCKQKLLYINVLQYQENGLPCNEVWLKTADNSKINLTQDLVEECWKLGTVELIELKPTNIDELGQYFIQENHTPFSRFKPYTKLFHTSKKGIIKSTMELIDYAEATERVKGCNQTFAKSKALVNRVEDKEILVDTITYETYVKSDTDVINTIDTS